MGHLPVAWAPHPWPGAAQPTACCMNRVLSAHSHVRVLQAVRSCCSLWSPSGVATLEVAGRRGRYPQCSPFPAGLPHAVSVKAAPQRAPETTFSVHS